jgi:uncharacterized iron-regulated membrane protein
MFLLLLCLTGMPLIFHEEIEAVFDSHPAPKALPVGARAIDYDKVIAGALAARPDEVVRFVGLDPDDTYGAVFTGKTLIPPPLDGHVHLFDKRSGDLFAPEAPETGFMDVVLRLHTDLFIGLPGYLLLGTMGILLVASLVSGVIVYTPFMRKLEFATVRTGRSRRLQWLDLHNVLGMVTLVWVMVVGVTGVINTLALPIVGLWQNGQLAEMTAPYKNAPPLKTLGSLHAALETARAAAPELEPVFVAFPGTLFSSQHHYAVFMRGKTPVSSKLLKPALIDAQTGQLTDMRDMPLYVRALLISQPLHFGDYGRLPLKFVWAVLDMIAIVVLSSGVYLWWGRRRLVPGAEPVVEHEAKA